MSSGPSQLGLGLYKFITDIVLYKFRVWNLKDVGVLPGREGLMEICYWLHYRKCRKQCLGSLTHTTATTTLQLKARTSVCRFVTAVTVCQCFPVFPVFPCLLLCVFVCLSDLSSRSILDLHTWSVSNNHVAQSTPLPSACSIIYSCFSSTHRQIVVWTSVVVTLGKNSVIVCFLSDSAPCVFCLALPCVLCASGALPASRLPACFLPVCQLCFPSFSTAHAIFSAITSTVRAGRSPKQAFIPSSVPCSQ